MKTKELLTIEFRYTTCEYDVDKYHTKIITIGIYDTIEEAIKEGNKAIDILSEKFQVRADDKFSLKYILTFPKRLVTNTCYPTKGIQYFAKITRLDFSDLSETMNKIFEETSKKA